MALLRRTSSAVSALRPVGFVAASVADAVNDLFTAKFLQIVGGVARAVLLAMTGPSYTVKNTEAIAEGSDMRARLYTLVPGDVIAWDRRIPRRQQHQERR